MHVELIGSTSAGKTTLAKRIVQAGRNRGLDIYLSDDFILERNHLDWIRNEFIRRRLVELVAFAACITCIHRYREFLSFVFREGGHLQGSRIYRINRIRNVIRKIGVFELITRWSDVRQVILADNEGVLQGLHNLFIHRKGDTDVRKISRYIELAPVPDAVLYIQQDVNILLERTLKRGHARLMGGTQDEVVHFIQQAVIMFNSLIQIMKVRERLLIIGGNQDIQLTAEKILDTNFRPQWETTGGNDSP